MSFSHLHNSAPRLYLRHFGRGAPIVTADGKRHRTWVFRIVLSHSRKGYAEAV
jgi:hypothetical protein